MSTSSDSLRRSTRATGKRPRAEFQASIQARPNKRVLLRRKGDHDLEDTIEQSPDLSNSSTMTLEQAYPEVTLPIERKSLKLLIDGEKLNCVSYEWKTFGKPAEARLAAMKDVAEWEFRKHFVGFSTNKFVFQLIKEILPNVSLSSNVARDIHQHLLEKFDEWKSDFLYNRCYAWVRERYRKYQQKLDEIDQATEEGRKALKTFFDERTGSTLFKQLYGAHCEVLDVNLVFAKVYKNKLPIWYFQQLLPFLCAKMLLLVKSEWQKNLTTGTNGGPCPWSAQLPENTAFVQDHDLRSYVSKLFDSLGSHKDFETVELDIFPWNHGGQSKLEVARAAKGAAPTDVVSNFINKELVITSTPPPAGRAYRTRREEWDEEWSLASSDSNDYDFVNNDYYDDDDDDEMPDPIPILLRRINHCEELISHYQAGFC
ncbi:hypothetical protein Hte_007098 [Hypoxylon texense]